MFGKSKILFCDIETTGVDSQNNAIVQIAAIMDIDGEPVDTFHSFMRPFSGAIVDEKALDVNNITKEQLAGFEHDEAVRQAFCKFMGRFVSKYEKRDKCFLAGFNVGFDDQFLRQWFLRNGDKFLGSYKWPNMIQVDALATVKLLDERHTMEDFKLVTVANRILGEDPNAKNHDAMYDIERTRALYYALKKGL